MNRMKFRIILKAALLFMLFGVQTGWTSADEIRTGICALQGTGVSESPDYVRVFQLKQSRENAQWGKIEKLRGEYDFSMMDEALAEIQNMGKRAIIKLNANIKPDWLFDCVPYHRKKLSGAMDDKKGTLMYWHPNFIEAHEKLLIAFGEHLRDSPYKSLIAGVRMNLNAIGTEHTLVSGSARQLSEWIIPEGVDPDSVAAYSDDTPEKYKDAIVGLYVKHILPHAFVWVRTNIPDETIEKYRAYFENGKIGFFHTGAAMEQNQVYFSDTHRHSRFMEFCRTGKTNGFTEVDGYHIYAAKYRKDETFPMVQFNYWRLLSEMHCGVSLAGTHQHMFEGPLTEGGPKVSYFDIPEFDAGWRFADRYLGLHASPEKAPGAWVALRNDTGDQYQGDYTYLMEREGNVPAAPLADAYPGIDDGSVGLRNTGPVNARFGAWARALPPGKTMTFHVDPRVFSPGENRIARIVYLDAGNGRWQLRQGNEVKTEISNADTGEWLEKNVPIESDGNIYHLISTGSGEVIFHMLEIRRP
jgi:hypothetical protein